MVTENTQPVEDAPQAPPAEVEPTTAEPSTAPERTFTQEEVNRMQAQTRRDERGKFSDYGDLKARAAKADELEQAQLSDTQKLEARAIEAERKAVEAQEQIASAMIASEVKIRASALGVIDPDAAYLLLDRSNVRYDAADGVSGVDDALASLLDAKPYLKGTNRTPNINPESGQPVATIRLTAEQREAAKYLGMSEEQYAKGL
jgi:phage I-like protein|tara:strand:- start:30 stop:638 length:609 start_codon:yes stop_codon:yes gene_type:complete